MKAVLKNVSNNVTFVCKDQISNQGKGVGKQQELKTRPLRLGRDIISIIN